MKLPIDVKPNTNPPIFVWEQVFDVTGHPRVIQCEGVLPPSVEGAVLALIKSAREQKRGLDLLLATDKAHREFIAAQQERIATLEEELSKRPNTNAPIPQGGASKRSK